MKNIDNQNEKISEERMLTPEEVSKVAQEAKEARKSFVEYMRQRRMLEAQKNSEK